MVLHTRLQQNNQGQQEIMRALRRVEAKATPCKPWSGHTKVTKNAACVYVCYSMYTPKLNMYTKVEGLKRLASYLKEQSLTPRFLVRCESFFLSLSLSLHPHKFITFLCLFARILNNRVTMSTTK